MNNGGGSKVSVLALLLCCAHLLVAQAPFDLDASFSTEIQQVFVNSALPDDGGGLIISGRFRFSGVQNEKRTARLTLDGTLDPTYNTSALGGGRLVPWNIGLVYVGTTQTVRRLLPSGYQDPSFIEMNLGRYFTSLQGGDYHVYPDGRVLMSGAHVLSDSIRGFEGLYSLIWFSNEGYLDTTRTHRLCNGVIYAIEEQPDGKFLCTGTMTTYEGQPVSRVFRVEADGTLDPSFTAEVQPLGAAQSYFVLQDGRIMIGGSLRLLDSPQVRSLIRLHSDGSLDESFNLLNIEATFTPSQIPNISAIFELSPDRYIITGLFDKINGLDRGGIAMIDSSGVLVEDVFDGMGCGAYDFVTSSLTTTYKSIAGIVPSNDGGYFIYGAYHGYDDGTTNDTTQRMVSKLYGLSVGVEGSPEGSVGVLRIQPNPTPGRITVSFPDPLQRDTYYSVIDATGRLLYQRPLPAGGTEEDIDLSRFGPGTYILRITDPDGQRNERVLVE
jgi:uncharacterized delta-60 repeat protein